MPEPKEREGLRRGAVVWDSELGAGQWWELAATGKWVVKEAIITTADSYGRRYAGPSGNFLYVQGADGIWNLYDSRGALVRTANELPDDAPAPVLEENMLPFDEPEDEKKLYDPSAEPDHTEDVPEDDASADDGTEVIFEPDLPEAAFIGEEPED